MAHELKLMNRFFLEFSIVFLDCGGPQVTETVDEGGLLYHPQSHVLCNPGCQSPTESLRTFTGCRLPYGVVEDILCSDVAVESGGKAFHAVHVTNQQ